MNRDKEIKDSTPRGPLRGGYQPGEEPCKGPGAVSAPEVSREEQAASGKLRPRHSSGGDVEKPDHNAVSR